MSSAEAPTSADAEVRLGGRAKELRAARGWSQEDLARQMRDRGFSWRQTTVAKTEAADRPIRVNEAVALATIYGCSVDDLTTPDRSALHIRLDRARAALDVEESRAEVAAAEVRVAESNVELMRFRLDALREVADYVAAPSPDRLASAASAALHTHHSEWVDVLVEAGVPRDVLVTIERRAREDAPGVELEDGDEPLDIVYRLITERLHGWAVSNGGEDDGQHRQTS